MYANETQSNENFMLFTAMQLLASMSFNYGYACCGNQCCREGKHHSPPDGCVGDFLSVFLLSLVLCTQFIAILLLFLALSLQFLYDKLYR